MIEYKTGPAFVKSVQGRTVTGIFAVHGNVDSGMDRSYPRAFAKTFSEGMRRIKFLWMHDSFAPPTAVIKSLREIGREELPDEVLNAAPEVLGGAEVTREYLMTERGDEILTGIVSGAINEMSYGYDALKWDMSQEVDGRQVRNLRELKLYDVSDVTFGMNPLTTGSKFLPSVEWLFAQLAALAAEIKAGNRNNAVDQSRIDQLHELAVDLGASNCAGTKAAAQPESRVGSSTHSDSVDVARLYAEFQRNIARLSGVPMQESGRWQAN